MRFTRYAVRGIAAVLALPPTVALATDDHPLLSRFEEATVYDSRQVDYDARTFPMASMDDGVPGEVIKLEGRIQEIYYEAPKEKSVLEVTRNYEQALNQGEFDILFSCTGLDECGSDFTHWIDSHAMLGIRAQWHGYDLYSRGRIWVARHTSDQLSTHFLLAVVSRSHGSAVQIIQVSVDGEPMATGQVEVGVRSAGELQDALGSEGRVVVDGIFFEFDSDEIRAESDEALEQMALLLSNEPDIQVLIVGHTDNQGSLEYNRQLSERRARAVRQALVSGHGIDEARLLALGVGFAAPVASNGSEAGRAQNRRVELVLAE